MYGLTIRWSLIGEPTDLSRRLRSYVLEESHARFTGMADLHQKIWTLREQGSFSGTWIFANPEARRDFVTFFRANPSRVSTIIGHPADAIEEFEVVAVAEGAAGLARMPELGTARTA